MVGEGLGKNWNPKETGSGHYLAAGGEQGSYNSEWPSGSSILTEEKSATSGPTVSYSVCSVTGTASG